MLYRAPPPDCLAALQKRSKKRFEKSVLQVEFTLSLPLVAHNLIFPLFFFFGMKVLPITFVFLCLLFEISCLFFVFLGKTALLRRAGQERLSTANNVVWVESS